MEGNRKWIIACIVLCISFSLLPGGVHAQPDPDGDPDAEVPIDGGVGLLVAAGVGYGIKKWRDERQNKTKELY